MRIFTQPDELLPDVYDPQQLNRYMFERANPYKYEDPQGEQPFDPLDPFREFAWKFKWDPNFVPELLDDLERAWQSDEMKVFRGVWGATGKPYYDVTELVIDVISGEDPNWQEGGRGAVTIGLTTGAVTNPTINIISWVDIIWSFFVGYEEGGDNMCCESEPSGEVDPSDDVSDDSEEEETSDESFLEPDRGFI